MKTLLTTLFLILLLWHSDALAARGYQQHTDCVASYPSPENGRSLCHQAADGKLLSYYNSTWNEIGAAGVPGGGDVTAGSVHTFTNKTYDVEAVGNVFTETGFWDLDLAACIAGAASHVWNTGIITAPTATCFTGANSVKAAAQFPDADNDHGVFLTKWLPPGFTGNLDADIDWWSPTATAGDVVFQIATICVADGETDDPAFNAASVIADTAKGTVNQVNTATISNITKTGCAAGERMHIKFFRNRTHASDTIVGVINVDKIRFTYRVTK